MNGNGHGAWITVKRAAETLGCSEPAIHNMARRGHLTSVRLGGYVKMIPLREVRALVELGYEPLHGQRQFWRDWEQLRPTLGYEPVHSPEPDEEPDSPSAVVAAALACVIGLQPELSKLLNGYGGFPDVSEEAQWVTVAVLEHLDRAESLLETLEKELGEDQ